MTHVADFPENKGSDWSFGWQCEGDGPIYTWKNKLEFKKEFPSYVEGSEKSIEAELKKANQEGIVKKWKYLEDNFYDACMTFAKDMYINNSEWICCKISGDETPAFTIHQGSRMKFVGKPNSNFNVKSLALPPAGDVAASTYSKDNYKWGKTAQRPPWNNGYKCLLET